MKIVSIVGTRPQLIKASLISKELRKNHCEILVHTGQHYDENLSDIFLKELNMPIPNYNLKIGSGSQGWQTGQALIEIEKVLLREKPDLVLVYGDCNSTLAGALAAVKLHIPVAHVESGCRSFDRRMPEEFNRIVVDHISDILFCATKNNAEQLAKEGITKGVHITGDIMFDVLLEHSKLADKSKILEKLNLKSKEYILATVHRAENTDSEDNLKSIFEAFVECGEKIVLPLHPRTKQFLEKYALQNIIKNAKNIIFTEPLGYLDFQKLELHAKKIATDSGGVQKEAYFLKIPCITLRKSTEWVETAKDGWMDVEVNLSEYAGKEINLELVNQPTGWAFEGGYWAEIKLVSE